MAWTERGFIEEMEKAKRHLQPGETVIQWTNGVVESTMFGKDTKRSAVVLATEGRIVIYVSKMFGSYELEEFPYSTMTSFEVGKGLTGHTAKFNASGNNTRITMMNRGDPQALIDFVRSRIGNKNPLPASRPVASGGIVLREPEVERLRNPPAAVEPEKPRPTKACPFCAETILAAAVKCRYCQSDLSTQA